MSYDLNFYPRHGELDTDTVRDWLLARPNWRHEAKSTVYENGETGVYMVLDINAPQDDGAPPDEDDIPPAPLTVLINLYRPSFFILECADELALIVAHFDLLMIDLQEDASEPTDYSVDGLVSAWRAANAGAHDAMAAHDRTPLRMPREKLLAFWDWNRNRERLMTELNNPYVPMIMAIRAKEGASTAVVWGNGIPTAFPAVGYVIVVRNEIAPSTEGTDDRFVRVPMADVVKLLGVNGLHRDGRVDFLETPPPPHIVRWIMRLKRKSTDNWSRLGWDQIHDEEFFAD